MALVILYILIAHILFLAYLYDHYFIGLYGRLSLKLVMSLHVVAFKDT